ncbi:MAG: nitroreductase family deazaflavin-dependent oxidoreductase [Halioglobus sp.]|nr:nitroreductase family deazaflavin-dependent oxidoreductase [Halioglobus sp.]
MVHVPDFEDGPPEWVTDHVRRYRETEGEDGHIWNGVTTLLLTTLGRNSGEERITPLIYQQDDSGNYVVIASRGGDDRHPDWYLNLREQPRVNVQVGAEKFTARAREATGEERGPLWEKMREVWPDYDKYAQQTDRPIPVVVLEPVD